MQLKALGIVLALATGAAFAQAPHHATKSPATKTQAAKPKQATQAMGAAPARLVTDLQAPARRARIDQAYANWQSSRR